MVGEILPLKCNRDGVWRTETGQLGTGTLIKNILVLKGQTNNVVRPNVPAME